MPQPLKSSTASSGRRVRRAVPSHHRSECSQGYDELCALGGFSKQAAIDENLDGTQAELSLASIGKGIMNYLAGSMTPMIPVLLAAGLFKTVGAVLGPSMLGIMAADSDLVRCMDMIYSAAFYFMPIYLGFNAAKQIGLTPILGAFLGGMLIEPSFTALAAEGTGFSIYGFLPCAPGSYAQTVWFFPPSVTRKNSQPHDLFCQRAFDRKPRAGSDHR